MRNGEWCGCSYGYGDPPEKYPLVDDYDCDTKGMSLGGVEANAVYSNDLNENENCQAWYDEECNDENCALWAHTGGCDSNADYMEAMCPQYCFPEPFRYEDNCQAWEDLNCNDDNCNDWAEEGKCVTQYDYMDAMCPVACEPSYPGDEGDPIVPGDEGTEHG